MTAQTSQGVASRLGYGLGQAARLVWCSQNRTLRWVKRLVVAAVLLYFSADIFSGMNRPGFSRHSQGSLRNAFQTLPVTADC